jgi:hypothetical protein
MHMRRRRATRLVVRTIIHSILACLMSLIWLLRYYVNVLFSTKRINKHSFFLSFFLSYINRSQTHECGNWGWGRAIPRKRIYKRNWRCSVAKRSAGCWGSLAMLLVVVVTVCTSWLNFSRDSQKSHLLLARLNREWAAKLRDWWLSREIICYK